MKESGIKDKYVQIRCTDEQRNLAKALAEEKGLNVSQYFWYLVYKDKRTKEFEHSKMIEEARQYD